MYIYVIQLDLLYHTVVQWSGFWTTCKQISLRFFRLSVEVPRSIIWQRRTNSENLCFFNTARFSTTVKTINQQFIKVKICVSTTLQDFLNCENKNFDNEISYFCSQLRKDFCNFLQISSEKVSELTITIIS